MQLTLTIHPTKQKQTTRQSDPAQLGAARIPAELLPPAWRGPGGGALTLPLDGASLHAFLAGAPSEAARRAAYLAGHAAPARGVALLDEMVAARAAAAALLGAPSYAHLKAGDGTLARAPEAAEAFLRQLAEVRGEGWCVGGKVVDEGWWGVDVEGCVL